MRGTSTFSINKDTRIKWLGETGSLEFRAEIFNIFNRANLGLPNGTTYSGTLPSGYVPGAQVLNAPNAAPVGATFASPLGDCGADHHNSNEFTTDSARSESDLLRFLEGADLNES